MHGRALILFYALVCAPLASWSMRISDVPEFATLKTPAVARDSGRSCKVAAGTTVEIIGQTTDPGRAGRSGHLLVRVLEGSCTGWRFTVAEVRLTDRRDQPMPTTAAAPRIERAP